MFIRILLAATLMLTQPWAAAQTADSPSQLTPDQARAQRAKARDMKEQARKTYEAEAKVCQSKAIAIGCMSSAKERRTETLKQADALELEGRTAEREASRREAEAKAAKREAEASKRQAKEPADAESYRKKEAERAAERERRQAEEPAEARTPSQQGRGRKGGSRKKAREAETKGCQRS
jgi:hypothetical protein